MSKVSMREQMPITAAWIDELRKGFGAECINSILRRAMAGEPVFHATENGHEFGTPVPRGVRVGTDARGNRYLLDGPDPRDKPGNKPETMRERFYRRQRERQDASSHRVQASAPAAQDKPTNNEQNWRK